jgi:hypothetical protein
MNLCSHHHDEVCFEGKHCPACSVAEEKGTEIAKLNVEVDEAQSTEKALRYEIADLERQLNEPLLHSMHQVTAAHSP